MGNADRFNSLVKDFLEKNPQYKNEIRNFQRYLADRKLENKVFNLNLNHIDDYFAYSYDEKIGAIPTLTTHISALKLLFNYLITNEIDFKLLYAYIDTAGFKEKLSESLEKGFKKPIIEITLLNSILLKMDKYIDQNINNAIKKTNKRKRFFEIMIARLYAKLSLILPLKPNEMLELKLQNILNDNNRVIKYNGVIVKIPNNLRRQIIDTINYAKEKYDKIYSDSDRLFVFLYSVLDKKVTTSSISGSFVKAYKELEISEMLMQQVVGKKKKYIYPPESYKITAILSMLENGTNIVYLKKLTGLDMKALLTNYDFEAEPKKIDIVSTEINNSIVNSEYYTFI